MKNLITQFLALKGLPVYLIVGSLVFAEDAIFIGFILPGETAAVLGGVAASLGHANVFVMATVVVLAAIVGDSVGYEVGKHFGTKIYHHRLLNRYQGRLEKARLFLATRGGFAVFLGRFLAFFRATIPALAGTAQMPYRRFLAFNALGGIVWGIAFVTLGFLAGNSYAVIERTVGRTLALAVAVIVVIAALIFRFRAEHSAKTK